MKVILRAMFVINEKAAPDEEYRYGKAEVAATIPHDAEKDLVIPVLGLRMLHKIIGGDIAKDGGTVLDDLSQMVTDRCGKPVTVDDLLQAIQAGEYTHSPALLPERYGGLLSSRA